MESNIKVHSLISSEYTPFRLNQDLILINYKSLIETFANSAGYFNQINENDCFIFTDSLIINKDNYFNHNSRASEYYFIYIEDNYRFLERFKQKYVLSMQPQFNDAEYESLYRKFTYSTKKKYDISLPQFNNYKNRLSYIIWKINKTYVDLQDVISFHHNTYNKLLDIINQIIDKCHQSNVRLDIQKLVNEGVVLKWGQELNNLSQDIYNNYLSKICESKPNERERLVMSFEQSIDNYSIWNRVFLKNYQAFKRVINLYNSFLGFYNLSLSQEELAFKTTIKIKTLEKEIEKESSKSEDLLYLLKEFTLYNTKQQEEISRLNKIVEQYTPNIVRQQEEQDQNSLKLQELRNLTAMINDQARSLDLNDNDTVGLLGQIFQAYKTKEISRKKFE